MEDTHRRWVRAIQGSSTLLSFDLDCVVVSQCNLASERQTDS